jgi:hypothetical protein
MKQRAAEVLAGMIVSGAVSLTGCEDRSIGTIRADRQTVEEWKQNLSDRPSQPMVPSLGKSRNRPDLEDLSPKNRERNAQQ